MSPLTSPSTVPVSVSNGATGVPVTEQARSALERLLDLGVQVVDGNLTALLEVPAALAEVSDALHGLHGLLEALPVNRHVAPVPVLFAHAARRKHLDMQELNSLLRVVAGADRPEVVGRHVVISALVLLSNLESDERWYGSLHTSPFAA